jgi:DNA-binding IscR family transcriptional regulator
MHLNRGVEHGIEGMLYLARRCGDEPALIRDISRSNLEQITLEDILQAIS